MADIQSQTKITENAVVNSKAETPMVVNQKLLSALNYLRDELEKVQKENKDEDSAFSEVGDDGDNDREKNKYFEELKAQVEQIEKEKKEIIANGQQEREKLQLQLDQTREEKKQLEVQHQKLNRKKQEINELNENNQELNNTILKLQGDLSTSLDENEKSSQQLESLQSHIFEMQQQASLEISEKDGIIRDLQHNLDRTEREREEWEVNAMELKSAKDELLIRIKHLEREMDALKHEKETLRAEKNSESESLANLQNVLEEFEAAKQSEIREAVEGIQRRLATSTKDLAEFKERALLAENQLTQIKEEIGKTSQYEKEIKEKNLLIGKLRHEAVILNEHLTEALRRMREESSENNVDKRLITNLLIAFFNTPRGDSKRYEILQLMANMLQWTEEQKEQVGLIRRALTNRSVEDRSSGWVSGLWTPTLERTRSRLSEEVPRPTIRISEDEGPKESFSDMWISFLLKEVNKENKPISNSNSNSNYSNSKQEG
ncbi:12324_t:CDS:2 [Funneliformis caledonium]|uniref:12324_t:CDS:1 n=1 Tax=Funneliformis caledonium TaxID=1117310 RepID=A0A9N9HY04_9GLOM|nr:12324_t:CDS:2 [Funneliformis caledonium]